MIDLRCRFGRLQLESRGFLILHGLIVLVRLGVAIRILCCLFVGMLCQEHLVLEVLTFSRGKVCCSRGGFTLPQTIAPLWKITRYFLLPLENVLRSTELCKSLDIMWKWKWKKYLAIILKTLHYIIYTSYQIILSIQCKSPSPQSFHS
jgi:hypothetical protein